MPYPDSSNALKVIGRKGGVLLEELMIMQIFGGIIE
jgi:hypothetical protein